MTTKVEEVRITEEELSRRRRGREVYCWGLGRLAIDDDEGEGDNSMRGAVEEEGEREGPSRRLSGG